MSSYSWPLLDACTTIKHALNVFCHQISQTPLLRLVGELHGIYKIGARKASLLAMQQHAYLTAM